MLSGFRDSEFTLSESLKDISRAYYYIIIDCMPSIGNLTENAIIAADEIIIPSEPQFFSVKGIQSLYGEIVRIKQRNNPNLSIAGILATKLAECNVGYNLFEYDPNGKGVQAYQQFVDEYIGG